MHPICDNHLHMCVFLFLSFLTLFFFFSVLVVPPLLARTLLYGFVSFGLFPLQSPILHLRSFNNWVKSILIRSYLPSSATVLDLCCGKGGDLLKWKEGGIEYLVCADISSVSVDQCKERYMSRKVVDVRSGQPPFKAEFIVADCCEVTVNVAMA